MTIDKPLPWWWTTIPDEAEQAMLHAVRTGSFTAGDIGRNLEGALASQFTEKDAVLVNSGTAALTVGLLLHGIHGESEVLVPALTWIATAQAAALLGARVRVVDIDPKTLTIDPDRAEEAISHSTRGIVPVFFNGRRPDTENLDSLKQKFGIKIVEDRCKAMGVSTRSDSSEHNVKAFSLGMFSLISSGYGGFLTTNSKDVAARARRIRDHGVNRRPERYVENGGNFKQSDILAALAMPQVDTLQQRKEHLSAQLRIYDQTLGDVQQVDVWPGGNRVEDNPTYVDALLSTEKLVEPLLNSAGKLGVSLNRYHLSIEKVSYLHGDDCPNARSISKRLIHLPSGPGLSLADVQKAADVVRQCIVGK